MTATTPLLEAREVTVSHPGGDGQPLPVLQRVTLAVNAGEVLAVVGPSGGGKSTLLRLFNRLLEPDNGEILFAGEYVRNLDPPSLRAQVPLVAQKPFLFPGSVRDNLLASARLRRVAPPALDAPEIAATLDLCQLDQGWLKRDARKMSIGQQQRICLARALLGPCRALLLDETTGALDRPTADLMARTFRRLAGEMGLAIIFVTHDLRLAELCADRVALLLHGRVEDEGLAARVLHQPATEAAREFLAADPPTGDGASQ